MQQEGRVDGGGEREMGDWLIGAAKRGRDAVDWVGAMEGSAGLGNCLHRWGDQDRKGGKKGR